jgi:hypothetical protein
MIGPLVQLGLTRRRGTGHAASQKTDGAIRYPTASFSHIILRTDKFFQRNFAKGAFMKRVSLVLIFLSAVLGFVPPAFAAAKFEAVMVPNSPKSNPAFFRIEVATGKVVSLWGYGTTSFVPTVDTTALPPGEYHLYGINGPQTDGTVYYSVDRMEVNSGRVWNLTGGGDVPFTWIEVTSTAAPVTPPAAK